MVLQGAKSKLKSSQKKKQVIQHGSDEDYGFVSKKQKLAELDQPEINDEYYWTIIRIQS